MISDARAHKDDQKEKKKKKKKQHDARPAKRNHGPCLCHCYVTLSRTAHAGQIFPLLFYLWLHFLHFRKVVSLAFHKPSFSVKDVSQSNITYKQSNRSFRNSSQIIKGELILNAHCLAFKTCPIFYPHQPAPLLFCCTQSFLNERRLKKKNINQHTATNATLAFGPDSDNLL